MFIDTNSYFQIALTKGTPSYFFEKWKLPSVNIFLKLKLTWWERKNLRRRSRAGEIWSPGATLPTFVYR